MNRLNLWISIATFFMVSVSFLLSLYYLMGSHFNTWVEWLLVVQLGAMLVGAVNIYLNRTRTKEIEKHTLLAEDLFFRNFGKRADKTEIILRHTFPSDSLKEVVSDKTEWVKFWSDNQVLKGRVDVINQVLYIEEPELTPVYTEGSVPLWKEVTSLYSNGMPRKVEFYDDTEFPHREEYFDKNGALKKGSWRRCKGSMEYWDPKKEAWEPVP